MAPGCSFGLVLALSWLSCTGAERAGSSMLYRSGSFPFGLFFEQEYPDRGFEANIPAANIFRRAFLFVLYHDIFFEEVCMRRLPKRKKKQRIESRSSTTVWLWGFRGALGYMVRLSISATLLGYGFFCGLRLNCSSFRTCTGGLRTNLRFLHGGAGPSQCYMIVAVGISLRVLAKNGMDAWRDLTFMIGSPFTQFLLARAWSTSLGW